MNAMGHNTRNFIGVKQKQLSKVIRNDGWVAAAVLRREARTTTTAARDFLELSAGLVGLQRLRCGKTKAGTD
jgi:hypothetical protein